jgi:peptidoglycan/xylan/chitin deacetylase (PgdA/CDA1 family)
MSVSPGKKVTLSFDNGPDGRVTPHVVRCLASHDVKTTFFVLGEKVSTPEGLMIAQRAAGEGHWIGNHTYTHTRPLGELDAADALGEVERTEQALAWVEQPERLFRPFGGAGTIGTHLLHPSVVQKLHADAYTCVLWNSVPGDWHDPEGWVDRAVVDCRSRQWSLVVLHDLPSGAMSHLDEFIQRLRDDGFAITQEFPPECVPIVRGEIVFPIDEYVALRRDQNVGPG